MLDLSPEELNKIMPEDLATGIIKMRNNQMHIEPGFDGQYGKVLVFSEDEQASAKANKQTKLF